MIPEVGSTCAFEFKLPFEDLNGVYRVRAETTFKDAVLSKMDFMAHLFTPAGLSQSDYESAYPTYVNDRLVVLESVLDNNVVYYIPESVLSKIPDPTIKEYYSLNMVVSLGVHKNSQAVLPLLDQIKDMVQASVGIENPLFLVTNPNNKQYLTDAEYDVLDEGRKENIQRIKPLSTQLHEAENEIIYLKARLAAYEERFQQAATNA